MRKIKIGDIIIGILLLALSFTPFFFLKTHKQSSPTNEEISVVKVNNKVVKKINLKQNTVWTYDKNGKRNVLEVRNKKVHMVEANCKDQICVKEGWKSKPGQTIVCLPHKFLVEIKQNGHPANKKDFDHTLVNP